MSLFARFRRALAARRIRRLTGAMGYQHPRPTLGPGDRGILVAQAQRHCAQRLEMDVAVDGVWGPQTQAAVLALRAQLGMTHGVQLRGQPWTDAVRDALGIPRFGELVVMLRDEDVDSQPILRFGDHLVTLSQISTVNADGHPRAYHPDGSPPGLLHLGNGGRIGKNWWGGPTDTGKPDGQPLIQGPGDPAPGYYVCATAVVNRGHAKGTQRRYVHAGEVAFLAQPRDMYDLVGVSTKGELTTHHRPATGRTVRGMVADVGPRGKLRELSLHAVEQLGHDPYRTIRGHQVARLSIPDPVLHVIHLGTGDRRGKTQAEIEAAAPKALPAAGIPHLLAELY